MILRVRKFQPCGEIFPKFLVHQNYSDSTVHITRKKYKSSPLIAANRRQRITCASSIGGEAARDTPRCWAAADTNREAVPWIRAIPEGGLQALPS